MSVRHPVILALSLLCTLLAAPAAAQPSFTSPSSAFTEDFTGFTGAGFVPTPGAGQLDSDAWRVTGLSDDGSPAFGGSYTTGDFARGTSMGGVTSGGVYAFDVNSGAPLDAALGVQPTGGDFTPGSLQLRIQNNLGRPMETLRVAFTVCFLNNGARSTSLEGRVVRDSDGMSVVALSGISTPGPADTSGWACFPFSGTADLSGSPIADGGFALISFDTDDLAGTGSRDEIALTRIGVSLPECGNGRMDGAETCDDGNIANETACPYGMATCTTCNATCTANLLLTGRACGDGTNDPEEVCDDSNAVSETECAYGTPSCSACAGDCQSTLSLTGRLCGDGTNDAEEVCDDGNTATETECVYGTATCTLCAADCASPLSLTGRVCGDGTNDAEETCDDGNTVAETACAYGTMSCTGCAADCAAEIPSLVGAYCGDSNPDTGDGETCDDGNTTAGDGCDGACMLETDAGPATTDGGITDGGLLDDGGMVGTDAGTPDAGASPDGSTSLDASVSSDAGGPPDDRGGCSCHASGAADGAHGWGLALLVLGIALACRRRRR